MSTMSAFQKELEHLINCHSMEGGSDTPDFMLAKYLTGCLSAFNEALVLRERWYGRELRRAVGAPMPEGGGEK